MHRLFYRSILFLRDTVVSFDFVPIQRSLSRWQFVARGDSGGGLVDANENNGAYSDAI